VLLTAATRGGFVLHVVTGTAGRMILEQLVNLDRELVALIPILLALSAAVGIIGMWRQMPGSTFVAGYWLAAAIVSLTVAKEGSYINYFLDLCTACSLAASAGFAWLATRRTLAAAFVLVLAVQTATFTRPNALSEHLTARLSRSNEYNRLAALVRDALERF